ncbi:MAG: hypothetical protein JWO02_2959, partial [Solirubrobacterales bacterium]|nr:hypothetical protein [Solirubrobacterales bacterium]
MKLRMLVGVLVLAFTPAAAAGAADAPLPSAGGLAELTGQQSCGVPAGTVDAAGAPQVACQTLAPLVAPGPTVASADGRFVYVAGGTDAATIFGHGAGYGGLLVLSRDPATGALGRVQCLSNDTSDGAGVVACDPITAAVDPAALAISPDGTALAMVASGSGSLTLFRRDAQSGTLSEVGCAQETVPYNGRCKSAPSLEGVTAVAFSPDGKDIYAASTFRSAIVQLRADEDGSLTRRCISADSTSGSCARAPQLTGPVSLHVSPDGRFVYALTLRGVTWLARDADTGVLSPGGCVVPATGEACGSGRTGATDGVTGYFSAPQVAVSPGAETWLVGTGYAGEATLTVLRRSAQDGSLQRAGCLTQTPYEEPTDEELLDEEPLDEGDPDTASRSVAPRQAAPCAQTPVLPAGGAMVALADGRFVVTGYGAAAAITVGADGTPRADGCLAVDDNRCAATTLSGTATGAAALPGGGAVLVSFGVSQLTSAPTATARAVGTRVRLALTCPATGGSCSAT